LALKRQQELLVRQYWRAERQLDNWHSYRERGSGIIPRERERGSGIIPREREWHNTEREREEGEVLYREREREAE